MPHDQRFVPGVWPCIGAHLSVLARSSAPRPSLGAWHTVGAQQVTHREFPFVPLGLSWKVFPSPSTLSFGLDSGLTSQRPGFRPHISELLSLGPGDFTPERTAARPGGGGPASGGEGMTAL